jgi:AcrR family transcriptional regulator
MTGTFFMRGVFLAQIRSPAVTRRAQIIAVATKLFRERGFHAVGIDEIGTAAGISGPGVYRHFENKDDLLVSVFEEATDDLWRDLDPEEHPSVEAYVRSHVGYALAHADAIELWYQEGRHLPPEARRAQRRLQRRYVERWVEALRERRRELGEGEARLVVQATIGLIHSATHSERAVEPDTLGPILERMAMAALLA